jgi:DHA3 family macrolide efflux protein-like MFS transporter
MPSSTGGESSLTLLRTRSDFRKAYAGGAISEIGDAFQFVALMWFAVDAAGPAGVIAVRLADSVPALIFGAHAGGIADRFDRRRTMIATDLARGLLLVPVAVAAVGGSLPLWSLVLVAFMLTTATTYFTPAARAFLPSIVGVTNMQQANALVTGTNASLAVVGWSMAAALLVFISVGAFFAVNAASFVLSAAFIARVRTAARGGDRERPSLRHSLAALRPRPGLRTSIALYAAGMVVMTGVWTVGLAELAHSTLRHGAAGLSLLLAATAVGTVSAAILLAIKPVQRKVFRSCLVWVLLLPGYLLLGFADSLAPALLGTLIVGFATGAAFVLLTSAAQESVPDDVLGRVMGLVYTADVGAKPIGLIAIAPLFAVFEPTLLFVAGGLVVGALAVVAAAVVSAETRRAVAAA